MVKYSEDIVAWAIEQASYLRNRRFEQLDIENIADALEDIVKGEQRELAEQLASLTALTLTGKIESAYDAEMAAIRYLLQESPSLVKKFKEPKWRELVEAKILAQVIWTDGDIQKTIDKVVASI